MHFACFLQEKITSPCYFAESRNGQRHDKQVQGWTGYDLPIVSLRWLICQNETTLTVQPLSPAQVDFNPPTTLISEITSALVCCPCPVISIKKSHHPFFPPLFFIILSQWNYIHEIWFQFQNFELNLQNKVQFWQNNIRIAK